MRKFFKWTGIILLFVVAGLYIVIELRQNRRFDAPYPSITASSDSVIIARGKRSFTVRHTVPIVMHRLI